MNTLWIWMFKKFITKNLTTLEKTSYTRKKLTTLERKINMAILQPLYAIGYYNPNLVSGGFGFVKSYYEVKTSFGTDFYEKEKPSQEEKSSCEEQSIYYTCNSPDKGFEIFSDLEEAKKTYFNYLNYLIEINFNISFKNYASFYKVIELTTPSGFKPSFDSYEEFCMRSVCDHKEFEKFFTINENSFKYHLSDILQMTEKFKTDEEFYNFKFQSLTQYQDIKKHTYPNDSIYYTFSIDTLSIGPSFAEVNKNTYREYKMPCGREMISGMYRVLQTNV